MDRTDNGQKSFPRRINQSAPAPWILKGWRLSKLACQLSNVQQSYLVCCIFSLAGNFWIFDRSLTRAPCCHFLWLLDHSFCLESETGEGPNEPKRPVETATFLLAPGVILCYFVALRRVVWTLAKSCLHFYCFCMTLIFFAITAGGHSVKKPTF